MIVAEVAGGGGVGCVATLVPKLLSALPLKTLHAGGRRGERVWRDLGGGADPTDPVGPPTHDGAATAPPLPGRHDCVGQGAGLCLVARPRGRHDQDACEEGGPVYLVRWGASGRVGVAGWPSTPEGLVLRIGRPGLCGVRLGVECRRGSILALPRWFGCLARGF